jgi:Saxitoxin biosynthesis operon protein SxtJ
MSILSAPKLPSERRFGLMIAAACALLGLRGVFGHWQPAAIGSWFGAGLVLTSLALFVPRCLALPNKAWFLLGRGLGKVFNPIVLGVIFFGILTPLAIVTRLFGRDELRLKRRMVNSHWIDATSLTPTPDSFRNQF